MLALIPLVKANHMANANINGLGNYTRPTGRVKKENVYQ